MAQYITVHRAPGLLQEEWAENAVHVYAAELAKFKHAYVNLGSGFIVTIYEAESEEALIEQFERMGLPHDEVHEIQFSQSFEEMEGMLKGMGKI